MSDSIPIPRSRSGSTLVLSPRSTEASALAKLRFEGAVHAVYYVVKDRSIGGEACKVAKVKLNERDLSQEAPEVQEQFYMLLGKYINKSSYSWELEKDVVFISLHECEDDPEWLALTKKGTGQGSH